MALEREAKDRPTGTLAGKQMSEAKFKFIPNRTLAVNPKTVLTVNRTVDTPAANAQHGQALASFAKLSAK